MDEARKWCRSTVMSRAPNAANLLEVEWIDAIAGRALKELTEQWRDQCVFVPISLRHNSPDNQPLSVCKSHRTPATPTGRKISELIGKKEAKSHFYVQASRSAPGPTNVFSMDGSQTLMARLRRSVGRWGACHRDENQRSLPLSEQGAISSTPQGFGRIHGDTVPKARYLLVHLDSGATRTHTKRNAPCPGTQVER